MKRTLTRLFASVLLMTAVSAHAQTYLITTVAGNSPVTPGVPVAGGLGPEGGQATASKLNTPTAVATDDSGNFYIADKSNSCIRKVSKAGIITIVAGTGSPAYTGDGSAATAATLNFPTGVAKDKFGNIFIADMGNNVVRKVSGSGIITTFAGGGTVSPTLGDGGPATAAYIGGPAAIAVDTLGDLFIVDQNDARIRRVDVTSGDITTVAGTTSSGYNMDGEDATAAELNIPSAVAVDYAGNVYIADQNNYRIRKVTQTTGKISTIAGTGTGGYTGNGDAANTAEISYTYGVAVDRSGNVFISDNNEIRKITASSGIISIYAGRYDTTSFGGDGGAADTSKLNNPQQLAVDTAGSLYIADEGNQRIRKVYLKSTVGVQQVAAQNMNISILPNPNDGSFTIKSNVDAADNEKVSLSVVNMLGQSVYESSATVNNGMINTGITTSPGLPAGYYLLHITSGAQTSVLKFVIQR